jgi:formiminotetrahydrofolate cyclodeaminase
MRTDSLRTVREQTIDAFLADLAARTAAPGGGAAAALQAAEAAALLAMVARYSDGPKYSADADEIAWVLEQAERLRESCADLIDADAAAFGAVAEAYKLPKDTAELAAARTAAIAAALIDAAEPPTAVIKAGGRLIELAGILRPIGNRNVIADVAAAAEAIRAAVAIARMNVDVNLRGITDDAARARFADAVRLAHHVAAKAAEVSVAVSAELER